MHEKRQPPPQQEKNKQPYTPDKLNVSLNEEKDRIAMQQHGVPFKALPPKLRNAIQAEMTEQASRQYEEEKKALLQHQATPVSMQRFKQFQKTRADAREDNRQRVKDGKRKRISVTNNVSSGTLPQAGSGTTKYFPQRTKEGW